MLASSGRSLFNLVKGGRAVRLALIMALAALLSIPLSAQYRSGISVNSPGFHGTGGRFTNLPPGTGFNGILGSRNPGAGLNGLPPLQNRPYRSGNCFNCRSGRGDRDHNENRGRRGGYGYGSYGYGAFPFVGGYVPLFDNYAFDGGYSTNDQTVQPVQPDAAALALGNEIYQLKGEVDRLKDQKTQQNGVPAPERVVPYYDPPPQPSEPATVIILRNGRKIESANYAIMNQTLWNFTAKPVQKIPLSAIDLSASERANADRGVDFSIVGAETN